MSSLCYDVIVGSWLLNLLEALEVHTHCVSVAILRLCLNYHVSILR